MMEFWMDFVMVCGRFRSSRIKSRIVDVEIIVGV